MGLDQGPKFQELMRVARIGVLTKELNQNLQDAGRPNLRQRDRDLLPQQ